jgi:hypothetical protein
LSNSSVKGHEAPIQCGVSKDEISKVTENCGIYLKVECAPRDDNTLISLIIDHRHETFEPLLGTYEVEISLQDGFIKDKVDVTDYKPWIPRTFRAEALDDKFFRHENFNCLYAEATSWSLNGFAVKPHSRILVEFDYILSDEVVELPKIEVKGYFETTYTYTQIGELISENLDGKRGKVHHWEKIINTGVANHATTYFRFPWDEPGCVWVGNFHVSHIDSIRDNVEKDK